MLRGKLLSTIDLIEKVETNKQTEKRNSDIAKINSMFFDSLEKLIPSIRSYILVKRNFDFMFQTDTAELLQYLIDYSNNVFNNKVVSNLKTFKNKSDEFVNKAEKEWETFCKEKNSELVSGLNIIVLVYRDPNVVKCCINALNKCEKWPLTQGVIDLYDKAYKQADVLLNEMHFDDEIRDFLIKVRDKNATLADITPPIMDWIRAENISDKVSLGIKNTM